jgi:hypothetical protein
MEDAAATARLPRHPDGACHHAIEAGFVSAALWMSKSAIADFDCHDPAARRSLPSGSPTGSGLWPGPMTGQGDVPLRDPVGELPSSAAPPPRQPFDEGRKPGPVGLADGEGPERRETKHDDVLFIDGAANGACTCHRAWRRSSAMGAFCPQGAPLARRRAFQRRDPVGAMDVEIANSRSRLPQPGGSPPLRLSALQSSKS